MEPWDRGIRRGVASPVSRVCKGRPVEVDYAIELGRDDETLEIPWVAPDGGRRYLDLKREPQALTRLEEAVRIPELHDFLSAINSQVSLLESAKCDAWGTTEINPEEEIFGASCKFTSYIDLLFADEAPRTSFEHHEALAKKLCDLLHHVPEMAAAVELIIRRCLYHLAGTIDQTNTHQKPNSLDQANTRERKIDVGQESARLHSWPTSGFYITAYVSGFGDNEKDASQCWNIALKLLQYALVQLGNG